jgi:membrane carboxypeptidase/penicillin-binding protein
MPDPAFTPEAWAIMDQILRIGFVVEFASVESFDGRCCQGPVAIYDADGGFIADFGPRDRRAVPTVAHLRKALAAAKKEAETHEE